MYSVEVLQFYVRRLVHLEVSFRPMQIASRFLRFRNILPPWIICSVVL